MHVSIGTVPCTKNVHKKDYFTVKMYHCIDRTQSHDNVLGPSQQKQVLMCLLSAESEIGLFCCVLHQTAFR